jgi:hypothetical protein
MNIADAIKQCAESSFEAKIPCDVFFGTVTGVAPYEIECGGMKLPTGVTVVTEGLKEKICEFEIGEYKRRITVNEGLKKGDGVVLLRKCGGGAYVAVAKL